MIARLFFCTLLLPAMLPAQQRAGVTGAQVLQFLPGSRAAAFSGAYAGVSDDADAIFYNPAGIGTLQRAVALSYEKYVSGIAFGSLGAATRLGALTMGLSLTFLDAGEIDVVVPDPTLGGVTGVSTGETVSSTETALRLVGAYPLSDGRLRIGAAAGVVVTTLAEQQQSAAFADLGAQYDLGSGGLGIAVRNLGPQLEGDGAEDYLPTELSVGGAFQVFAVETLLLGASGDLLFRVGESEATFVTGLELGLPSTSTRAYQILGRVGFDAEKHRLGAFRVGATIGLRELALDYTYQQIDFLGAVHRFGLRLNRPR